MQINSLPADQIDELPDSPAVFTLRMISGAEPYIGKTKRLRSRLQRLLGPSQAVETKRLNLAGKVDHIEYAPVFSDFEARYVFYAALKQAFPTTYSQKLRLRPAPLIRISWANEFPRAVVTRKLSSSLSSTFYGPFRSRKEAETALNASLDLHLVRRCSENLSPHPTHPGCIYGEMKMCLSPCQQKVYAPEYLQEAHRLQAFLDTSGESHLTELAAVRDLANANLAFEEASEIHAKWLKTKQAAQLFPDCSRPLDRWNAVLLLPGPENALRLFKITQATLSDPVEVHFNEPLTPHNPKYIADTLNAALDSLPVPHKFETKTRSEHLKLLQKWLFSSPKSRIGELVLADPGESTISSRRLANAALRLLAPLPQPIEPTSP